jgi:hypothetical protein
VPADANLFASKMSIEKAICRLLSLTGSGLVPSSCLMPPPPQPVKWPVRDFSLHLFSRWSQNCFELILDTTDYSIGRVTSERYVFRTSTLNVTGCFSSSYRRRPSAQPAKWPARDTSSTSRLSMAFEISQARTRHRRLLK